MRIELSEDECNTLVNDGMVTVYQDGQTIELYKGNGD